MNFVDSLNIFGVEAKQIPTIILHGAPSESTEGAVGVLGMDVDSENHDLYKCVAVSDGVYTWEPVGGSVAYTTKTVTLYTELWGDLNADGNIIHLKTVEGMTADALVEVAIAADQAMMEEACRCGVYCAAQGDNYLIFRAMYDTPTIDIDVIVKVTT